MRIWGFDLGVRGYHAAAINVLNELTLHSYTPIVRGKISDQAPEARARELLHVWFHVTALEKGPNDHFFIEEPPLAGSKNLQTYLKLAQVSSAVAIGAAGRYTEYVPVDTWKKTVCGKGGRSGMDKAAVSGWLEATHPKFFEQCAGDQNYVDAVCIALYGCTGGRAGLTPSKLVAS